MAFITVNELRSTGVELFQDSESYLNDLNNLDAVYGGQVPAQGGISAGTATVLGLINKGYEFGLYTIGIDAIGHMVKSYSAGVAGGLGR
jgi:hypothetical protein